MKPRNGLQVTTQQDNGLLNRGGSIREGVVPDVEWLLPAEMTQPLAGV